MKKLSKKSVIIIVVAAVLVVAIATTTLVHVFGGGDFRSANWGMSPEQVKNRENAKLVNESEYKLTFQTDSLMDVPVETNMFYDFDGLNGLWQVTMGYTAKGFDDKTANRIISAFEEKYGEPTKYEENMISYEYYWVDDRTEIRISQQQTYLLVSYTDVNYVIEYDD